ncbi:HAD-IIB family hydrolase [Thiomicrorhabdus xiamenensis]|uniref:HAD-IIB family hydrolase n=1 Tax=Thiomicrorhabdus xiamenensis TaxID=2739063 RepID=A0A7D4TC42_9GAMM|nr:HAD-IIB family hydrolase [Thiomicrorhabdus xiamenensis]QKI90066.1 HAD-IIB family hydrolase [Thiomicrorhabdus xiamenensis]
MNQFNYVNSISESGVYVFTDLDGTLLGHHDYQYAPVLPAIEQLKQFGIPLILNSSKTFAEISQWLDRLDLQPPFIAENGGVIYFSKEDPQQKYLLGRDYAEIRTILGQIREQYNWRFTGFGDCSVEEVMASTSLDYESAAMAKRRAVSEPISWQDSDANLLKFKQALEHHDLRLLKGGRFYHVMSHHDKASALKWVVERSESARNNPSDPGVQQTAFNVFGRSPYIVALGDGENDRRMLEEADLSLILPAQKGNTLKIDKKSAFEADKPAPEGWAEAVQQHLLIPLNSQLERQ